jgi:serine/threonine-protein kinase
MLAGRTPFEGETPLSVAVQHLREEPDRLENLRPDLPQGLCRIVHRLLAKAPGDRYPSPSDVMRDLRTLSIEGLEEWSSAAEEWDTPELLAISGARSEATLRLETLMKSQARVMGRRSLLWRLSLPILAGLFVGVASAWLNRPDDLLTVTSPTVERKDSAKLQFWHAMGRNTEEAWLAVEANFSQDNPINRVYALRAKEHLAELFRDTNQLEQAARLYGELADLGSREPQLAAHGLIGQANLLAQEGENDRATAKLADAVPLLRGLPRDQVETVIQWLDPDLGDDFEKVAAGEENLQNLPLRPAADGR